MKWIDSYFAHDTTDEDSDKNEEDFHYIYFGLPDVANFERKSQEVVVN